jgi:beta-glucosidase
VTVEFELGAKQLRYWSAASRRWVQDVTELDVWVGGSSAVADGPAAELTVTA